METANIKENQFRNAHELIRNLEVEMRKLEKISFPAPATIVTIARWRQQIVKMKTHLANLEKNHLKDMNAIHSCIEVLEKSISDPSYVGSARSEEAFRTATKWLKVHAPSSTDGFYKQVQKAAREYARLRKD